VDKGAETGLMSQSTTTIYAPDMEAQIAAEARGVTRRNIPWDTFLSTYCGFDVEAQSKLTAESVKDIGDGDWEENVVWKRLRKVLSVEVRYSGSLFMSLSRMLTYQIGSS
jgi:hypothetical protein